MWDALCAKFEDKAPIFKADLRQQLSAMICLDENEVENHINSMVSIQECLSSMDDALPLAEFAMKIIGSLPISYRPTTSALSAMAKRTKAPLEPDEVIEAVLEEFHCRKFQDKAAETALAAVGKGRWGKFRTNQNASSCEAL